MQKIALIGCGMMGRVHSGAYSLLKEKGLEVKYVSDPIKEKAENCSAILGNTRIATFEEVLNDSEITMVDICTPTYKHKDMVIEAAKNGKNIFCEKPIAIKYTDAIEMINICKYQGVKLGIGHVTRFFPEYVKNLELVQSGEIGKPVMARLYRGGVFPMHGESNWFNAIELSGGVIVDLSIHDIDYARQIFGEVEYVNANSAKLSVNKCLDNFDHSMVVLRFKNGAIAHIEGSWAQPSTVPVGFKTSFEIYGKNGMINYDSEKSSTFKFYSDTEVQKYLSVNATDVNPYALELAGFIDALNNSTEVPVSGNEGMETLRIAQAANISAEEGRIVYMKELNMNG